MKFTILPQKKKNIRDIQAASKKLNHKVFLAEEEEAILMAAFAFRHDADEYVSKQSALTKAMYTVVHVADKPDETPPSSSSKPGKVINNLIPKLGKGLTIGKQQSEPESLSED